MNNNPGFMHKSYSYLNPQDNQAILTKCHALASNDRLQILQLLYNDSKSVTEIAKAMYMSVSTATFHLHILRDAGFIDIGLMPGKRGHVQLCQINSSSMSIYATPVNDAAQRCIVTQDIPVGMYTGAAMEFVSGFATSNERVMFSDSNYFTPRRAEAQLLWSSGGYVEYAISNLHDKRRLKRLTFTLELCSETLRYKIGWKSDITFWLNGRELCTFTSPSDYGGRRGQLNPTWWPDGSTQYGDLKEITINESGCLLDGIPVTSSVTVASFDSDDTLVFRIGNKPDAKYKGGFNIFGKGFGDHMQDIRMEAEYESLGSDD